MRPASAGLPPSWQQTPSSAGGRPPSSCPGLERASSSRHLWPSARAAPCCRRSQLFCGLCADSQVSPDFPAQSKWACADERFRMSTRHLNSEYRPGGDATPTDFGAVTPRRPFWLYALGSIPLGTPPGYGETQHPQGPGRDKMSREAHALLLSTHTYKTHTLRACSDGPPGEDGVCALSHNPTLQGTHALHHPEWLMNDKGDVYGRCCEPGFTPVYRPPRSKRISSAPRQNAGIGLFWEHLLPEGPGGGSAEHLSPLVCLPQCCCAACFATKIHAHAVCLAVMSQDRLRPPHAWDVLL